MTEIAAAAAVSGGSIHRNKRNSLRTVVEVRVHVCARARKGGQGGTGEGGRKGGMDGWKAKERVWKGSQEGTGKRGPAQSSAAPIHQLTLPARKRGWWPMPGLWAVQANVRHGRVAGAMGGAVTRAPAAATVRRSQP
jgi:hypothetical protein